MLNPCPAAAVEIAAAASALPATWSQVMAQHKPTLKLNSDPECQPQVRGPAVVEAGVQRIELDELDAEHARGRQLQPGAQHPGERIRAHRRRAGGGGGGVQVAFAEEQVSEGGDRRRGTSDSGPTRYVHCELVALAPSRLWLPRTRLMSAMMSRPGSRSGYGRMPAFKSNPLRPGEVRSWVYP